MVYYTSNHLHGIWPKCKLVRTLPSCGQYHSLGSTDDPSHVHLNTSLRERKLQVSFHHDPLLPVQVNTITHQVQKLHQATVNGFQVGFMDDRIDQILDQRVSHVVTQLLLTSVDFLEVSESGVSQSEGAGREASGWKKYCGFTWFHLYWWCIYVWELTSEYLWHDYWLQCQKCCSWTAENWGRKNCCTEIKSLASSKNNNWFHLFLNSHKTVPLYARHRPSSWLRFM